jgi:hypothetical protein
VDGFTDNDIVNYYPQAIADGDVPGWPELQHRFPELAGEMQALRLAKGWLETPLCCELELNRSTRDQASSLKHEAAGNNACQLGRWLVSFATESDWYPVGEFLALNATAAIERAVEIFGPGAAHRAEEIPWDAAPLSKANLPTVRR